MNNIAETTANEAKFKTLLAYVADSLKGYETVSDKLEDNIPQAQATVGTILAARTALADRISEFVNDSEDEAAGGTIAGAAHRALIEVKDLVNFKGEDGQLIEEVVRGENALIEYIDKNFDLIGATESPVMRSVSELKSHVLNSILTMRNLAPETLGIQKF